MSEFDDLLKYVVAQAEHGRVKFIPINRKLSEREINNLLELYPFIIEDKFRLTCGPPGAPLSCYLSSDTESIACQTVTETRVMCYSAVTGHVFSPARSKKILEMLKSAYALCEMRLRKTNDAFGVQSVPRQNKPQGEPKNDFERVIQKLHATTGIPPKQAIVPPPSVSVVLNENMPRLAPCYTIAKVSRVIPFVEALNKHDFAQAKRSLVDVVYMLADLNLLGEYMERVKECGRILEEM
jgi:hypothetical protein